MFSREYEVIHFSKWEEFRDAITSDNYAGWAFRGQSNEHWPLQSSLSRYLKERNVHRDAWQQQESQILRIFRRKAHLLLDHIPGDQDSFEWLALMQHHGAPTRLLDFTWSPFVATFFAVERATSNAAVWALFPPGLSDRPNRTLHASQRSEQDEVAPWVNGGYEKYFLPNKRRLVVIGEPHRMNQRLVAQSGTFVMPGVLDEPVEELASPQNVVKFVVDLSIRKSAMAALYQMNISNATLFPGLDGLARSLAYELEYHWAFDTETMEPRTGFYIE